jgi:hypothetical protein
MVKLYHATARRGADIHREEVEQRCAVHTDQKAEEEREQRQGKIRKKDASQAQLLETLTVEGF